VNDPHHHAERVDHTDTCEMMRLVVGLANSHPRLVVIGHDSGLFELVSTMEPQETARVLHALAEDVSRNGRTRVRVSSQEIGMRGHVN